MKEAAGEANITVITIVLIGLVAAAGAVIIPRMIRTVRIRSCCTNELGGTFKDGRCNFINPNSGKTENLNQNQLWTNWQETCGFNE